MSTAKANRVYVSRLFTNVFNFKQNPLLRFVEKRLLIFLFILKPYKFYFVSSIHAGIITCFGALLNNSYFLILICICI